MNQTVLFGLVTIIFSAFAFECPDENQNSTATYFPHETECGKFYECHYGEASLFDCSPGTYWDSRINVCSFNVDCGNLSTSTSTSTSTSEAPTTSSEATTAVPTESPDYRPQK